MQLARLLISAPAKSHGKTQVTLGLARAFQNLGKEVQCFKKGPDYIDPMWHQLATGRPSYNLDPYLMGEEVILTSFAKRAKPQGIHLIEGNHGLHDGLDEAGQLSSAGLANLLQTPVVLVVDVTGMNRGVAALVLGQMTMQPKPKIGGVILNRVKSERQRQKQEAAIAQHCGIPILGALPVMEDLALPERHLGLITTGEAHQEEAWIQNWAQAIAQHCEVEALARLADSAPPLTLPKPEAPAASPPKVRIGVVRDEAFCFYYPENLEALEAAGAELIWIHSFKDKHLPLVDGLYLGGGFPESFLPQLEANHSLRRELKARIEAGLPVYAECGGLIYLAQRAEFKGVSGELLGVLPGHIEFSKRPAGYGYMELETRQPHWLQGRIKGHEFHYSKFIEHQPLPRLYQTHRGVGTGAGEDGVLLHRVTASYAHLHALSTPEWAPAFIEYILQHRS